MLSVTKQDQKTLYDQNINLLSPELKFTLYHLNVIYSIREQGLKVPLKYWCNALKGLNQRVLELETASYWVVLPFPTCRNGYC